MDKWVIRTKRKRTEDDEEQEKEGEDNAGQIVKEKSNEPAWPETKKKKETAAEPKPSKGKGGRGSSAAEPEKVIIRRTQGNRHTTELTLEKHPNYNEQLTKILQGTTETPSRGIILILSELGNLEKSKGQMHRFRAYSKAGLLLRNMLFYVITIRFLVKALQAHPKQITSVLRYVTPIATNSICLKGKEAQELDGIGAKIGAKIDEILASGKLNKLKTYQNDPELMALDLMQQVSGIGPAAAKKFVQEVSKNKKTKKTKVANTPYQHGIHTLEDLERHKHLLNHHQLIGNTLSPL